MKIILLQDVKALGKKGELVNVNDGYARNFILPKKLGVEANSRNMNDLKLQKAHEEKRAQEIYEEARALGAQIAASSVRVSIKTGEGGKIFGSVSSKEISQAASEQLGLDIDKKKMQLDDGIKALGMYEVNVKLHSKVTGILRVKVTEA